MPLCFGLFTKHLFPAETSRSGIYVLGGGTVFLIGATLITPVTFYSDRLLRYFDGFVVVFGIYVLYITMQAARHKREGARVFIFAFIVFLLSVVNDILSVLGILPLPHLLHIGMFWLICMQALLLSLKFSRAFAHVECLSAELDRFNKQLERTVQERTRQLVQSEKMASLGKLIANIAHEVNTPLGAIQASATNMDTAVHEFLQRFPVFFQELSPEEQTIFWRLVECAIQTKSSRSSREERSIRRQLRQRLESANIQQADDIADSLVDMGFDDNIEPMMPLFSHPNAASIVYAVYTLSLQRDNSANILQAIDRISKIVFALRTYTHSGAAGEMVRASIPHGINVVLTLYDNQLKQGITVVTHYDDAPLILCYPDELNQVWTNLIYNAIQAMEGHGTLEIAVSAIPDRLFNEDCVCVSFTNTGPQIPDEIRERIFEPFFTTKPAGEGSGLGLDICRKIIKKHQGTIHVESQPENTTFSIRLPISPADTAV
jgi:signal transduction histidine kinase